MTDGPDSGAPVFVLVHSPLVGPLTWSAVADALSRRGHTVVVPVLTTPDDAAGSVLHHHAEQIRVAVEARTRTAPVVLVGHSGAGPLLPAAGDNLTNEVAAYVFVDAGLPKDQATRLDDAPPAFADKIRGLAEDGRVPPWAEWWGDDVLAALLPDEAVRDAFAAELAPIPLRLFEERVRVPAAFPDAPCGYLLLSAGYEDAASSAARLGWDVLALDAGHLHMLVEPHTVAVALEELAGRLVGGGPPQPDPISAQRERIGVWIDAGRRVGFGALALALVVFVVALYWDLPGWMIQTIVGCLVLATLSLLPSMIAGYGVAAAEREDAERRRVRRPGGPPVPP